jgi:hypothetical protein
MDTTVTRKPVPVGFTAALEARLAVITDRFTYAKARRRESYRTVTSTLQTMRSGVDALGSLGLRGQLFSRNERGAFPAIGIVGKLVEGVGANTRQVLSVEKRFLMEARACEREYRSAVQALAQQFSLPVEQVYAEVMAATARNSNRGIVAVMSEFLRGSDDSQPKSQDQNRPS